MTKEGRAELLGDFLIAWREEARKLAAAGRE
jgi:hypothetical protein